MRDQELRYLQPSRIRVGPFERFEVPDDSPLQEADVVELDRDEEEGWLWLTQRRLLPERTALTVVARVKRPGAEEEDLLLILVCEGE